MNLRLTRHTFLCVHLRGFYFRVFGRGLSLEVDRPKLFSERNGFRKVLRIGRLSIEVLK